MVKCSYNNNNTFDSSSASSGAQKRVTEVTNKLKVTFNTTAE